VLALACAACSTVYYAGLSTLPRDGRRLHGLAVLFGTCALLFVPLAVAEGDPLPITAASVSSSLAFVVLGAVLPTALVVAGVQAAGAASGATATLTEPLVLVLLAVLLLGEEPPTSAVVGALLVLLALANLHPLSLVRQPVKR
jgi:drug/metabolite transporter (DMT)-like permease